jgi:hypothetical protein
MDRMTSHVEPYPGELLQRKSILCAVLALAACGSAGAAENKACELVKPAEIESVLGVKVTNWNTGPQAAATAAFAGSNDVEMCFITTSNSTVLLRLAKKKKNDVPGRDPMEAARKLGAQVKSFGATNCSALVPSKGLEQAIGFNTTCSVSTASHVAAIEVTTKSQKEMVSIDRLHSLAEKMMGRF